MQFVKRVYADYFVREDSIHALKKESECRLKKDNALIGKEKAKEVWKENYKCEYSYYYCNPIVIQAQAIASTFSNFDLEICP